jgi:chemotaxis protein methyltransferase CheR
MMLVSKGDIDRFRVILQANLGLHFEPGADEQLAEALQDRLRQTGRSAGQYLGAIEPPAVPSRDELRELATRLTVPETYFFRYPEQLDVFAEVALAERLAGRADGRPLQILSAGCASGEEPYSLAMLIREQIPAAQAAEIGILGIDVNPAMLHRARDAVYSPWSLRGVSEVRRQRYFHARRGALELDEDIRRMVRFEERNLVADDPDFWQPERFEIIFCRNITIYFSPETTKAVVARLSGALAPGGYLFLGPSETLRGVSQEYHLRHARGVFYYQRRSPGEAESAPPPSARLPAQITPAAPLPQPEGDAAWADVIGRAANRIAALSRRPASPSHPRPPKDLSLAVELIRQERFDEALRALPEDAEGDADLLLLRAVILTNAGRVSQAEGVCREVLAMDELSAGAHYLMALCREHAGQHLAAVECDQAAIYLDPAFAMPRLHLGLLAKRIGDIDTARRELQAALALLDKEEASRIVLFGGGFNREALAQLCRAGLRTIGVDA